MKLAVVGVTGLVGTVMQQVLKERKFPITEFIPVASPIVLLFRWWLPLHLYTLNMGLSDW